MATVSHAPITDQVQWDTFKSARPEANFLQSWEWGEFHKARGCVVERIGFFRSNKLIGIVSYVIESARRATYMAVAGGPIIDWAPSPDREVVAYVFETLRDRARQHGCSFIRMRPQAVDTQEVRSMCAKLGFRPSPMHLTADLTSQLDLSPEPDELLANMRKSTRYEIRKAQKMGVEIRVSTKLDDVDEFYEVQLQTAKRQHFVPFSRDFLKKQFEAFAQSNKVLLYKSYLEGTLLAMAFVIFDTNEGVYHYGASTEEARRAPGAYLIQWEAICEARRRGCSRYNFWGVTPMGVTDKRFSSISLFKRGFGGEDVAYLPAQDLVIAPLPYFINYIIERVRHLHRRL